MRVVFWALVAFFYPLLGRSQEMTPAVTNMAGFDGIQQGSVVTMSIGEPAILTLATTQAIITQGFLQPEIIPCATFDISYYPNPASKEIEIKTSGCDSKIKALELINLCGEVILNITPPPDNKINLEAYSQAVYIIKVYLESGATRTMKIAKVTP